MCKISSSFKKALKTTFYKVYKITTKDYRTAVVALRWIRSVIVPNLRGLDLIDLKNEIHSLMNCVKEEYNNEGGSSTNGQIEEIKTAEKE